MTDKNQAKRDVVSTLAGLNREEAATVITEAIQEKEKTTPGVSADVREKLVPSQDVIDEIWVILFRVLALVLILSTLGIILFIALGRLDAATIFTVFTTIVGYLAGLVTPTPKSGAPKSGDTP